MRLLRVGKPVPPLQMPAYPSTELRLKIMVECLSQPPGPAVHSKNPKSRYALAPQDEHDDASRMMRRAFEALLVMSGIALAFAPSLLLRRGS